MLERIFDLQDHLTYQADMPGRRSDKESIGGREEEGGKKGGKKSDIFKKLFNFPRDSVQKNRHFHTIFWTFSQILTFFSKNRDLYTIFR
jgi:hypothetical protein